MAWILVTPSSRGIGLAITRHLLQTTPPTVPIVATTRASNTKETRDQIISDLNLDEKNRSRLDVQKCDLLAESSISDLSSYCKDRYQRSTSEGKQGGGQDAGVGGGNHLRLAFLLPGMLKPEKSPQQIEYESALETLKLNLLTPMMLLKYFVPFLPKKSAKLSGEGLDGLPSSSAVVSCMSARVGSISDNGLGGWYSYRASKAGLNQVVKSTDLYVRVASGDNAAVVGLHPGTVKTGLSKEFWNTVKKDKLFSPEFAAEKLVGVVNKVGSDEGGGKNISEMRGRCWDWKGEVIPP